MKPDDQAGEVAEGGLPEKEETANGTDEKERARNPWPSLTSSTTSDADEEEGAATVMLDVAALEQARLVAGDPIEPVDDALQDLSVDEIEEVLETLGSGPYPKVEEEEEESDKATVMLDTGAIEEAMGDSEEEEESDKATVMLDTGAIEEAMGDSEEEESDKATVMLDTGALKETVSAPSDLPETEKATVMLDASGLGDEPEEEPNDLPEVEKATVMLDTSGPGEEPATADEGAEIVFVQDHEPVLPDLSQPVYTGSSGLFEDQHEKLEAVEDQHADILADPRMPKIGDLIAERYKITEVVGKGGFAAVYMAEDTTISGKVAVKVLQPEKSQDPDFAERFRQEVRLARVLQHPNTIKVYDTGTTETDCLYMVMEFITGIGFDEYLKEHGALDPAKVVRIGEQILRSLAEAHQAGIVHRDLKPTNVMISTVGADDDFVKVVDFGIAKALRVDLATAKTETGVVFCTPKYAAPEVLLGEGIGSAVDVYACGLIMLEALTGFSVYNVGSDAEAIAHQLSDDPVPIPDEVSETAIAKVLERALAKRASDRYRNASEMLSELRKLAVFDLATVPIKLSDATTQQLRSSSYVDTHIFSKQVKKEPLSPQKASVLTEMMPTQKRSVVPRVLGILTVLVICALVVLWMLSSQEQPDEPTNEETVAAVTEQPGESSSGDEQHWERPDLPNSRDILGARLAASDWQAGSWLEPDVENVVAQVGDDDDHPAETDPVIDLDAIALNFTSVDPTSNNEQPTDPDAEADAIAAKAEAHRMALLYESAEANSEAFDLLHAALSADLIDQSEKTGAYDQLLGLTENLVAVLVRLDRCDAAERRLDRSLDIEGLDVAAVEPTVGVIRSDIEACRERVAAQQQQWDPAEYVAHIAEGDRLHNTATMMLDPVAQRAILFESIHARQQAIELIETALSEGLIPEDTREFASRDLAHLNEQVTATLMDLQLDLAVAVQIEDTLESAELLSEEAANDLAAVLTAFEAEEAAENETLLVPDVADEPGIDLAAVDPADTDQAELVGTGEGTGVAMGEGTGLEVAEAFTWNMGRFAELSQTGAALFEQAEDVAVEIRQQAEADAETQDVLSVGWIAAIFSGRGDGQGDGTGADVALLEVVEEEAPPTVYAIEVNITSQPDGCRVVLDGETLGRTPFSETIESEDDEITLSIRKTDFETERITISMTDGDVEESVELRARNPFGQTQTLGDMERRR